MSTAEISAQDRLIHDMADLIAARAATGQTPPGRPELGAEQASPLVGAFSRNPYGGHPAAGLTPVALAVILRSSIDGSPMRYLELAEDMEERFWQYASTLSTRKRAVANLDITVNAASDDAADIAEAELVREVITSSAFNLIKIDLLDAIGKSFSAVEMIWDTKSRPWKPVKFKHRDPRFFEFDRTDPEKLMLLTDHGREDLWENCWIVHRAKAKSGLTIRGGIARQAAWLYIFQNFNIKDWAIFAEAYGQPLRVGKFDPGASEKDKAILLEAVHQIGADYAAVIPQAMAIEFIKAEITGSTDLYERRADWLDRQCSKIVLGQTGTTDSSEGSGYAQAKVHDDVRDDIAEADGDQLAATLNAQLVIPLIDFNFPHRQRKGYPEIVIGRPEEEDVDSLVDHVTKLIPFGLEVSMDEMRKKVGVSAPENGAKLLTAPRSRKAQAIASEEEGDEPTAASVRLSDDAVADAIETALGDGGWEPLVAPLAADIRSRLLAAATPEEARAVLAQAFAGMDTSALTTQLTNAMFAARLAGEIDSPRTLYVSRKVRNGEELAAWAKAQGFEQTIDPADMHVTIAFSRRPLSWSAVEQATAAEMTIAAASGPRKMEQFGQATVLRITSSELTLRHDQIIRAGASWDFPEYAPHVTISYGFGGDLSKVVPYQGSIVLGPEIFAEVDEDWAAGVRET